MYCIVYVFLYKFQKSIIFRSNPGTPTQPRRPDFIGLNQQQQQQLSNPQNPTQSYYEYTTNVGPASSSSAAAGAAGLPPQHPQLPTIQQQQQMLMQQQRAIMQQQQQGKNQIWKRQFFFKWYHKLKIYLKFNSKQVKKRSDDAIPYSSYVYKRNCLISSC